jgi:hypothetical protein
MQAQQNRRGTMLELARQWRDSGAKARVFAQERGVTAWTSYYWRQRLLRLERPTRRRRRSRRRVRLAPVHVMTAAADGASDLEILLVGGDRLRVSAGTSVETLRRVIESCGRHADRLVRGSDFTWRPA